MTLSAESLVDDARLRRLADRAEINDVQLRYAWGTDSRDWQLFRSCFTEEIEIDFSAGFGLAAVRMAADDWVRSTAPRMESFAATQHQITNIAITFDGADRATCVAYVRAGHHLPNDTGDSDQTVHGYYTNRFERTPDGWRIAKLKLTARWMTGNFGIFQTAMASEIG
ncbi:nuclear transport factor 2 family protein [Actinoalloteichus hymeniacidonis]|uniref:SnoaL-like domain n=1 Tax=Actinoalloteichus hymeniacidonis TaxID=340345 RepID=A0AAC9HRA1_9PSEU|nr:nuclear transport factor 2 family protein [Actinoalloteichus hymeniacidonis]AOS64144.1 SnoaL-like domain [Actinoalloteichus hymeniacidonis]MBB5907790.1 3-phenylpropionate/cinnamic acid dioxygenase small subunit [Actinoalloteichus hymeniacidonis]